MLEIEITETAFLMSDLRLTLSKDGDIESRAPLTSCARWYKTETFSLVARHSRYNAKYPLKPSSKSRVRMILWHRTKLEAVVLTWP